MSLTKFINRGNVKNNLLKGQYVEKDSPNIKLSSIKAWDDLVGKYVPQELTPYQAAILNNFLIHSGYSGYDIGETFNKLGLTGLVFNAIKDGSDFTPYLRDALKNDSVALAAFDESLKQVASYDNILKTMSANKAKLAKAKAMEKQASALNEIKKQIEQATRNAQFMEKYGVPYNRINASKEFIKDALWRDDKSIYNSIKNMDKPTKFIGWNALNAFSPLLWNTPILEKIFGDRPLKDYGQAAQMATTGYVGSKLFGGASNKAATLAAMMQGLASLGTSSYIRQNQNKPNNTENQEKLIENKLNERNNKSSDYWGY